MLSTFSAETTVPEGREPSFIEQLQTKVNDLTITPHAECGAPFDRPWLRTETLKAWILQILSPLLEEIKDQIKDQLFNRHKSGDSKDYLLVLAILLTLPGGPFGACLAHFKAHQLTDAKLPLLVEQIQDLYSMSEVSNSFQKDEWDRMAKQFHDAQWRFCPLRFRLNMDVFVKDRQILPVCRKRKIKKGGVAVVWQIVVPEEFVDQDMRLAIKNNPHSLVNDDLYGKCYQLAVKTFGQSRLDQYANEQTAYYGLRDHSGMIQYLGSFGHILQTRDQCDSAPSPKDLGYQRSILLEYSGLDLEEVFSQRNPPVFPDEILRFWEALSAVAEALHKMHNLEIPPDPLNRRGPYDRYHGWHADIKPSNILSAEGKYKLADPGFAQFMKKEDDATPGLPKIDLLGGTSTYAAPERSDPTQPVSQSIDTWSLGCVYSLAATWIVFGCQGIRQYRQLRIDAIKKLLQQLRASQESDSSHPLARAAREGQKSADLFHNGIEVLPEVTAWHAVLRASARSNDTLTPEILKILDDRMLHGDEKRRATALEVWKDLICAVSNHLGDKMPEITQPIVKALIDIDSQLALTVDANETEPSSLSDTRMERKKKLLSVQPTLLRTSHRSEHLGFDRPGRSDMEGPSHSVVNGAAERHANEPQNQPWQSSSGLSKNTSHDSHRPSLLAAHKLRSGELDRPKLNCPQNVVHAYYYNKTQQVQKGKDRFLEKHFTKRDRDIMFLVDNCTSMAPFWEDAIFLLKVIAAKIDGYDLDGLDLRFATDTLGLANVSSKKPLISFKKGSTFLEAMIKAKPKLPEKTRLPVHTDMAHTLTHIFNPRLDELTKAGKQKKFTLIVMTDGLWDSMQNKDMVRKKIKEIMIAWKELWQPSVPGLGNADQENNSRPVSITFVQFGQNEDAFVRLRQLDNELIHDAEFVEAGIGDVVDHEMFEVRGDVYKIILGSFVPSYDEIDDYKHVASWLGEHSEHSFESSRAQSMASSIAPELKKTSISRASSTATVMPNKDAAAPLSSLEHSIKSSTRNVRSAFDRVSKPSSSKRSR